MIFGRIKLWLMAIGGAALALFAALARAKRAGRNEAEKEMDHADKERARYIRRRVDAQRLRGPDEIDYRD